MTYTHLTTRELTLIANFWYQGTKAYRAAKLLQRSQEKLAERSEISVGYLSKLERSIIENVSVTVLLRIAKSLDVTLNDLVSNTNKTTEHPRPNQNELNKLLDNMSFQTSEQLSLNIINSIKLLKQ